MNTFAALNEKLLVVCSLLDAAAGEVRSLPAHPVAENVHHLGNALAELYELLRAIYAVHPELMPQEFPQRKLDVADDRLVSALAEAYKLAQHGKPIEAGRLLSEYATVESSVLHRGIALGEREAIVCAGQET
jgi:hypothetical protein